MLEVKNLVKSYSSKGGVTVKALDNVSVKFPETGMVFLLGRSGSGKSTLLNVSGGLDKPDSGEVIVKGRSSKDFSTSDFDSYRNTYVGFVFQEYNILNEFTVEQNIALALQLQSKPNNKQAVEDLLEKVDLKGMGKRKPNTLSGGQKQRVAIARALIKEPEIIMADEPTGALDSNTGKQVLDTLKKLSETKLVVVVSHDREFAEQYGDRIIELQDGRIISDVSKAYSEPEQLNENVRIISDDTISIANAENITDADVKNIVALLKKNGGEAIISASKHELEGVKRACRINDSGNKEYFRDTADVKTREYDGGETKFIKSRLPFSRAFKMGASGLKTKPIRLIFTILLAVVAFVMFGVVSTFMLYDSDYSISQALQEADYPSITLSKYYAYISQSIKVDPNGAESVDYEYEDAYTTRFGVQELKDKNSKGQVNFAGIFNFTDAKWSNGESASILIVNGNSTIPVSADSEYYPLTKVTGFTDCGEKYMKDNRFTLVAGNYPEDETQVAIPEYIATLMVNTPESGIADTSRAVGKKIKLSGLNAISSNDVFTVSGVYDVGKIPAKYDDLKNPNSVSAEEREKLKTSLTDYLNNSFNSILYVTESFYDRYKGNIPTDNSNQTYVRGEYRNGLQLDSAEIGWDVDENSGGEFFNESILTKYPETFKFYDLDGNEKTFSVADGEVFVSQRRYTSMMANAYWSFANDLSYLRNYDVRARELLGEDSDFINALNNIWSDGTAFATVKSAVDEWYPKLKEREYLYGLGENIKSRIINESDEDAYPEFIAALEKIENLFNEGGKATDGDWETVKSGLENLESDETYKKYFYCNYARVMYYEKASESQRLQLDEAAGDAFGNNFDFLIQYVENPEAQNRDETYEEAVNLLITTVDERFAEITGYEKNDTSRFIPSADIQIFYKDYIGNSGTLGIAGYFTVDGDSGSEYFLSEAFLNAHAKKPESVNEDFSFTWYNKIITDYVAPADAKYNFLITLTDNSQEQIAAALESEGVITYKMTNMIYGQLEMFLDMIKSMQNIFLIVGLVFGVFSALMLLNFISVSISAKRKDIGILRAVGARGSDVFKIFFSEALLIALICFIIATVGAFFVCNLLNASLVDIISMKLLNFNFINVALIFVISLGISLIATFFPVFFASKKSPVDSIRAL